MFLVWNKFKLSFFLGSYKCACSRGYVAVDNGRSCKANATEYAVGTKLLLTNRYYLKLADLAGKTDTLIKDQINAVALDFDWASNCGMFLKMAFF